jgi:hypothetical protein
VALLTRAQYEGTTGDTPMTVVQWSDEIRTVPLAEYFSTIPEGDLGGHDFSARRVVAVYRDASGRFLHFHLAAATPDVFLVIVVDESAPAVYGHSLLAGASRYRLERQASDP